MKLRFVAISLIALSSSSASDASDPSVVLKKFGEAVEREESNPTKLPALNDLFASYSLLSYDSKFDAHIRCITLAHTAAHKDILSKPEADSVASFHVLGVVHGAKTPADEKKIERYEIALIEAAMVYEVAGFRASFDKDFPSCRKYMETAPAT